LNKELFVWTKSYLFKHIVYKQLFSCPLRGSVRLCINEINWRQAQLWVTVFGWANHLRM